MKTILRILKCIKRCFGRNRLEIEYPEYWKKYKHEYR